MQKLTEADTCRKFVLPKLLAAGWDAEPHSFKGILAANCNFDQKNPSAKEDITHLLPEQLATSNLEKEERIAEIVGGIRELLAKASA